MGNDNDGSELLASDAFLDAILRTLAEDYIVIPRDCYKRKFVECLNCGNGLAGVASNTKFCGNNCGVEYRRRTGYSIRPGILEERRCLVCERSFFVNKKDAAVRSAKYCSKKCSHQGQAASRIAGLKFVPKKAFQCLYCKKQNWCYPRQIRKYCDAKCYWAHRGRAA